MAREAWADGSRARKTYQSRLAYVGPASTSSELHPDSHTGRQARFASIDD